ncbi:predicted protein [Naegleria gruberi]|uniref:Predicted protein n=2 Tax=Naegleria gruberi TaxID=5762 RepID=D2VR82_NAEGR|nr:uncharacterized protein NAEGRDRAFT_80950 [Naegleria gruberi]EFC40560.1 predicted protein [Naegleria gruberi]|eukprot:XP_002673304.1 predicted protein [Naegleria gruberi strain NEG-M]
MAIMYGGLARSGKVKYQTPRVEKTSDSSYHGGCAKYKIKSSNNLSYSGGAHRLEKNFTEELKVYDQYKENHQRCDWVEERANIKRSEPVLLNSFHKFNTEKGFNKMEWNSMKKEENILKNRYNYNPNAKNHKKWHRNHPKDGFYQKRTVDANDLECWEDEVIQFSHLYE